MKIAVIGGGAIGSLVAGFLSKAEQNVLLVGRADHVNAINADGLKVRSSNGVETIKLKAATKLDAVYDLVIFATKTQDLEFAYQDNHQFLEDVFVLTTQNGVQADNILCTHFDVRKMFSSIVMFGATYTVPGEVTCNFPGDWIVGKAYTPNDPKLTEIAGVLKAAFSVSVSPNIKGMKWLKLFVNFNNCIPALTGKSMQETFADLDLCRLSVMLLREGTEIVKSAGIELVSLPQFPAERIWGMAAMPVEQAAGIINKTLTTLSKEPLHGSILQSIMRGKTSEIDFINGEVVQLAYSRQTEAPLNSRIVDMVHEVENSGKFFTLEEIKLNFNL